MRPFLMGLLECGVFLLATVNIRACSKGWIMTTLVTDMLIASSTFVLIKMVAGPGTNLEMGAYVVGACLGSLLGMTLTRNWRSVDGD